MPKAKVYRGLDRTGYRGVVRQGKFTRAVQCLLIGGVRNPSGTCKSTQTSRDFPVDNFASTVSALGAFLQGEKRAAEVRQRQCERFLASLAPLLHSGDDSSVRKCLFGMSKNCEKDQEIMQDLLNVLSVMPAEDIVIKEEMDREEEIEEPVRQPSGSGVGNQNLSVLEKAGHPGQVHRLPTKFKIVGKFRGKGKLASGIVTPLKSSKVQAVSIVASAQGSSIGVQNSIPCNSSHESKIDLEPETIIGS